MTTATRETPAPTQRPAWKALEAHYRAIRDTQLRALFAEDPRRGERLSAEANHVVAAAREQVARRQRSARV